MAISPNKLYTAKLGQGWDREDLEFHFTSIYGGVAWPGKHPGFAVIVAMSRFKHFDNYNIYLLDEFESEDIHQLVQQCGVLNYKYQPSAWIGDTKNDAADHFIRELNKELELPASANKQRHHFTLTATPILNMQCMYQYIFPAIKRLLDKDRRQLFLKNSKIIDYLSTIESSGISTMEVGECPAIEALAFAVIEMRSHGGRKSVTKADIKRWQEKYRWH